MKTHKLVAFIAVFISTVSFGQTTNTELLFSGGVTIGSLRGNEFIEEYKEPLASFAVNALVKFPATNHLRIVTGLQYERLGSQMKDQFLTDESGIPLGKGTAKDFIHYVTMPAYLEYTIGNEIRFGFEAGIFGSLILKHSTKVDIKEPNNWPSSGPMFVIGEVDYNDVNGGLLFGLNAQFPFKTHKFQIGVRDQYGLVNLNTIGFERPIRTNLIIGYAGLTISL